MYVRLGTGFRNGIIKRSEARSKLGFPVTPEDEVFFVEPKKELAVAASPAVGAVSV